MQRTMATKHKSKWRRVYKGFTLLELMVAIFLLATLIGIATPVYINQVNKSTVVAALTTLGALEQIAKEQYEDNSANTSISYGGVTFTNNVITAINAAPVVNGLYIPPSGNGNVASNQFLVCVFVGKLNFSGYVAPTAGNTGAYARICKQDTANAAIYTAQCGGLNGSSTDIPAAYLPDGCQCGSIWGGSC